MPKIDSLEKLFKAIAVGDHAGALSLATDLAAAEERKRHRAAARRLRAALASVPDTQHPPHPAAHVQRTVVPQSMLIKEATGPALADVCLRPKLRGILSGLILEHHHSEALAAVGLAPRHRLLLTGPPGTGKTLTARALAYELGLPAFSARLSSVIGSFLGETASNLRILFQFASHTPCILLLDEFDAIGRQRGRHDDVGEIDRVLVSMLQELDHQQPLGLIVAATNLSTALDPALVRRFDLSIAFPSPNLAERKKFASKLVRNRSVKIGRGIASIARTTVSYADVERKIDLALRKKILKHLENGNGRTS